MSTEVQIEAQTTKKYDLPLSHLDYSYIDKCSNVKELEKILRVLRSGDEGRYPDLEKFTEKRIEALNPKSRVLRQEGPILKPGDLSSGDWLTIEEDLKSWTNSMHDRDSQKGKIISTATNIIEGNENLPPVRSNNIILEGNKQKIAPVEQQKKKRVVPRDYKEWDKVNVDEELKKIDEKDNKQKSSKKSNLNGVSLEIDTTGMSEEEKEMKATREKDKGNEAFRSHDYEESVTYYSRSIYLMPTAASYNNRALAYLKLEKWNKAVSDCNTVLEREADNIKALLRRGTAFKSKKDMKKATSDFERVLVLEPQNKKAETLLDEVKTDMAKQECERKEKGRRMVIEEVEESSEEEEEVENIEVEKPVLNGHSDPSQVQNDQPDTSSTTKADTGTPQSIDKGDQASVVHEVRKNGSERAEPPTTSPVCSAPVPCQQTSALLASSDATTPSATSISSSTPSSTNTETHPTSSCDADSPSQPDPESEPSQSVFSRPVFVQASLPSSVLQLKEEGNKLFRTGQYGDAIVQYSKAISSVDSDKDQVVNKSVLLSNRAACHLKTGSCSQAVNDCTAALHLIPHNAKSLLRRAAAYEMLERYVPAYVDYKHVISVDPSALQAQQGANRCQKLLQDLHGPKQWRGKLPDLVQVRPWEIPDIVDPSALSGSDYRQQAASSAPTEPKASHVASTPPFCTSAKAAKSSIVKETVSPAQEAASSFEKIKAEGNQFVQKGNYQEALVCYSQCISQCPDQVACYTNRALCYLKLNKPTEAEADCNKALSLQPTNPKALYRRALAKKMLHQYKLSLQDLLDLLRVEPKNTAAKKEMEEVKKSYKEELNKLKIKKASEESKVRKRMKIDEVEDDEEEEKPVRNKLIEKSKASGKSRGAKSTQQTSSSKSKAAAAGKKNSCETESTHSPPVAPPIAPRLMKTTPYEFCQAWNSLRPCQGIQPYAEILRQIAPADLPQVISNKLDGQMLQIIVRCVYEEMVMKGDVDHGYQILDSVCQVPRFSTVSMFMSSKEKKEVAGVLDILAQTSSEAYNSADIMRLKKEYSVK